MPLEILNLNLEEEESSCAVNTNVSNSRNLLELLRPSAVLAHSDGDESLQAGSAVAVGHRLCAGSGRDAPAPVAVPLVPSQPGVTLWR